MQQFDFDIQFRKGKLNVVPDSLSRAYADTVAVVTRGGVFESTGEWYEDTRNRVQCDPEKFKNFKWENGELLRKPESKKENRMDNVGESHDHWRLCVKPADRQRVLRNVTVAGGRPWGTREDI